MRSPRYIAPKAVAEAAGLLADHGEGAHVIAGGTDLVVRMRSGALRPTILVDIEQIPGLSTIVRRDGRLCIGATVKIAALVDSRDVRHVAPVLAEAGAQMGAVQLRNLATVGGNLASAVPSADLAPPLLVMDAVARITGPSGERRLPIESFFIGPHRSALRGDEVLTEIEVPLAGESAGAAFLKFGKRNAQVLAVVNAAAWVRLSDGLIQEARIALGAVAPTPIRAHAAESMLRRQPVDSRLLDDAAAAAAEVTRPISDHRATAGFRRELSRVLTRRVLERAARQAMKKDANHGV